MLCPECGKPMKIQYKCDKCTSAKIIHSSMVTLMPPRHLNGQQPPKPSNEMPVNPLVIEQQKRPGIFGLEANARFAILALAVLLVVSNLIWIIFVISSENETVSPSMHDTSMATVSESKPTQSEVDTPSDDTVESTISEAKPTQSEADIPSDDAFESSISEVEPTQSKPYPKRESPPEFRD